MYGEMQQHLQRKIAEIEQAGLFRCERVLRGPQQAEVSVASETIVRNLCANNYLGLANHLAVIQAANQALEQSGYGRTSVRFICGTQSIHKQMDDLESKLKKAKTARNRLIATDHVFSINGYIAKLKNICDLTEKYDALMMVDGSSAIDFIGGNGRGMSELCGAEERIDIITETLGKALSGASGGYSSGRKEIIDLLPQRSHSYLLFNSVAPPIIAISLKVIELVTEPFALRRRLIDNTCHPVVPVMCGYGVIAPRMVASLLAEDVYVVACSYSVVPQVKSRIRAQSSAAHLCKIIELVVTKFSEAKVELNRRGN